MRWAIRRHRTGLEPDPGSQSPTDRFQTCPTKKPDRFQTCPTDVSWLRALPSLAVIGLVRLYQILLSPIFGRACRFHPTCSQYMILAVRKYGVLSGSMRGLWRICRCHPLHRGGDDWP